MPMSNLQEYYERGFITQAELKRLDAMQEDEREEELEALWDSEQARRAGQEAWESSRGVKVG
jgi:hypothetical protein